jgi:hypothetical protein
MKKPSILESSNYVHDLEKYCHSIEQDKIDLETEVNYPALSDRASNFIGNSKIQ